MCVYIYMCIYICVYIYIYSNHQCQSLGLWKCSCGKYTQVAHGWLLGSKGIQSFFPTRSGEPWSQWCGHFVPLIILLPLVLTHVALWIIPHCHGLQCVSAGMIMIYESWCILLWIVISTKYFLSSSSIKWYDWTSAMDLQVLEWVALKPPTSELVLQWICCFCQLLRNWPFRVIPSGWFFGRPQTGIA